MSSTLHLQLLLARRNVARVSRKRLFRTLVTPILLALAAPTEFVSAKGYNVSAGVGYITGAISLWWHRGDTRGHGDTEIVEKM